MAVVVTDPSGIIVYSNDATAKLFESDNICGRDIKLLIPDNADQCRNIKIDPDGFPMIKEVRDYETKTMKSNPLFLNINFGPIKLTRGAKHYGFIISFDDNTETAQEMKATHDIISSILPEDILARIKKGETEIFDEHPKLTVGFCDVVKYTNMCNTTATLEVAKLISSLFNQLDKLAKEFGVRKIETVGDCYMVACGFKKEDDQCDRVVNFMSAALKCAHTYGRQLRTGIASGPCLAGVVGETLPKYSLFGPTVNLASRLESGGLPDKLHICETVYQNLNKEGKIIHDGGIRQLKGFDPKQTYFVDLY
jgi:class 3 adenylate cyclase